MVIKNMVDMLDTAAANIDRCAAVIETLASPSVSEVYRAEAADLAAEITTYAASVRDLAAQARTSGLV